MQLGVLIGLVILLGIVAVFLLYYLRGAMNANDAVIIDEVPDSQFDKNANLEQRSS